MNKSFSFRWNSVQTKLLRSIALALALAISLSGVTLLALGSQNARTTLIDGLEVIAQIIADRSAASLVFRDAGAARNNLSTASNKEGVEQLCLYDARGQLFSSYNVALDYRACSPSQQPVESVVVTSTNKSISLRVPVLDQGDVLGHLVLVSNTKALNEAQFLFIAALMCALLFSLIVAVIIGKSFVGKALLPLSELYKTARVIAKNPLSEERAQKFSNDEFGRVVDVFNSMLDAFSDENKALILSESRFRSLSENSPVGVYLKSSANEYAFINPTWSEITGLGQEEASEFVSRIDVRDRENYLENLEYARTSGEPHVIEYQYVTPEGNHKALMEYVSIVHESELSHRFIGSLLDVTELKNAQVELEKLAFYDPLTKLPNRRFFRDHLEFSIARSVKEGKKIAVYMVDLDDFKKVNDSLGHDVGDSLLVKIASQLRGAVSDEDVISRMGGDEFMVLLDNIEDPTRLEHVSRRILSALKTSVEIGGTRVQVSGSIGAAIFPTDAQTPEELVRYADIALYSAKSKGGAKISYYSQDLDQKIKEKLRLEQKLRIALEENELQVYIQPQYIASTREMFWGEALIRWIDEDDGFIPPDVFIPLAEETGLIHEVGNFVLRTVCELLRDRAVVFEELGMDGIAVNLSARQFFSESFIDEVKETFNYYNVKPEQIEFEVTESMVMDDVDQAIGVMEAIRELGCRLSIDDFGTGYSSLSYLKRFPITSLKIDRSFIRDIPDDKNDVEIACAIIAMAHNLGLTVVAEGVETDIQAKLLASYNCEYLQGYFFDRPIPFDELFSRVQGKVSYSLAKKARARR